MSDIAAALERGKQGVAALTQPRNVVLVGATDRAGSWAARVYANLARYGFAGAIYPLNPGRAEIWGRKCYPDFRALPEPPDHLAVLVPAPAVNAVLREAAACGARSATVFSAGFGEAGDADGIARRRELEAIVAATGLAVSGPNCMGNVCGASRLVTLTDHRPMQVGPGPVALVGQSGGVMIFTQTVLEERGHHSGYVITSGNELGLGTADYIAFFAADPAIRIILCYVEAVAHPDKFAAACALAAASGKPVIVHKLGRSEAGKAAAMAHTGSLAGSAEVFDAVAGELGVIRVDTLDDAVEIIELMLHTGAPRGRRLGAITLSGAYRGLLLDAAERNRLVFPALAPATDARLRSLLSVGSLVGNPLDGGFGVLSSAETYLACVEALDRDPNIDLLLLQEELPRVAGAERTEAYLRAVEQYAATRAAKPIAFVSVLSHSQSDYSRGLRAALPHLSFLNESDKALRIIDRAVRRDELRWNAPEPAASGAVPDANALARLRALARDSAAPLALSEPRSKELLRLYGIATPPEILAVSPAAAVRAADAIGYPVVLKAVSEAVQHKSEVGGVVLGLDDAAAVTAAWDRIVANLDAHGLARTLEGMLVGRHVAGGVELALGLHRDPEMGLVVMAGAGGVLLELMRDVAFARPPLSAARARSLIAATRAARLIAGYRGAPPCDVDAVVAALVALGRIAVDLGDTVASIDLNPFVALPQGQGGLALDALVVLQAG
ncbi:MAG TPA: acetate--CoA ligase family protein [Stellaceae bacterium]|nr:acetate--CoA ligase family protein [Stellaceae bacterium]